MNIPEGFVLVPVEPTEKMNRNGDMNYSWNVAKIYRAMVEVAPPVELPAYDEAKERKLFERFWSENMNTEVMDLHRNIYPMNSGWAYACHETNRSWMTWKACAQSRDGSVSDE